jgi:hypothetical protein
MHNYLQMEFTERFGRSSMCFWSSKVQFVFVYFITFTDCLYTYRYGAVVVVLVWSLNHNLFNQCLSQITSWVRILLRRCVLDKHYVIKFIRGRLFFPGTSVSPTNKNDRHDITAILLKVTFNTMALTLALYW